MATNSKKDSTTAIVVDPVARADEAHGAAREAHERADHAMNGSRMAQSNAVLAVKRTMAVERAVLDICELIALSGTELPASLGAWAKKTAEALAPAEELMAQAKAASKRN